MAEAKEPVKRSLGRGLGSLLSDDAIENFKVAPTVTLPAAEIEIKTPKGVAAPVVASPSIPDTHRIWFVDIEKLSGNVYQPRKVFAPEKLQELAASVKEKGILQPIVARRIDADHFEIIAGERRWRAAQVAGLKKVPVILKEVENQESLELALIENLQRHDLNPIEEAEAYQQLANEFSLNQQDIAQKVGKDRATIANSLRLLNLTAEVRQMLVQGEITTGHAKVLLALNDPAKQRALAKKITGEKLTVRAAERLVQGALKRSGTTDGAFEMDVAGKLVKGLMDDLTKTLGTKVEIQYNKGKGSIAIRFYSDEDLTRIIEKIKN
jgi:ParB family chromosome partitioning protein